MDWFARPDRNTDMTTDYTPTVGDQITLQLPDDGDRTYDPFVTTVLAPDQCVHPDHDEPHVATVCVDCLGDWIDPLGDYALVAHP
jgi:hypothetical protein